MGTLVSRLKLKCNVATCCGWRDRSMLSVYEGSDCLAYIMKMNACLNMTAYSVYMNGA